MSKLEEQIQQAYARNKELIRNLAKTDHAESRLKQQIHIIKELERSIFRNEADIDDLEIQRKADLKDHEKYRDSHVRRLMYKATGNQDKFAAKASKEEKEYYHVLQHHHEKTVINDGLKQQLEKAKIAKPELEAAVQLHKDSQQELDSLYQSIFDGETADCAVEDALEQQRDDAIQRCNNARTRLEEENRVLKLVSQGTDKVNEALRQMGSARSASRLDMFGFDEMADAMERSALTKAEIAYLEAKGLAQRAELDGLPQVNINHGHIMRDVVFDSIATDIQFHEQIKRGQREMESFNTVLRDKRTILRNRVRALEEELKEAEKNLHMARVNLQSERMKLFEQLASNLGAMDMRQHERLVCESGVIKSGRSAGE